MYYHHSKTNQSSSYRLSYKVRLAQNGTLNGPTVKKLCIFELFRKYLKTPTARGAITSSRRELSVPKIHWLSAKLFAAQTSTRGAEREKVTPSQREHRYAVRPERITTSWHSAHLFAAPTLCTRREPTISETPTCRKQHSTHPKCPQNHTSTNFRK